MGIPGFARAIRLISPGSFLKRLPQGKVNSLLIDANGLFHGVAEFIFGYGRHENNIEKVKSDFDKYVDAYLKEINKRILDLLDFYKPSNTLVFAVDGVAPVAKINQQRSRRYKSYSERVGTQFFNPSLISPGTDLMFKIHESLNTFFSTSKKLPKRVIYSSFLTPGEGEHKIFKLIRANEIHGDGINILLGLDNDLFMLSLMSNLKSLYLVRSDEIYEESVDNDKVDVDHLRTFLETNYGTTDDIVMIMYLIGNDFLPRIPMFEDKMSSIKRLLFHLKKFKTRTSLTMVNKINWISFKRFLEDLAKDEIEFLERQKPDDFFYHQRIMTEATRKGKFDFEIYHNQWNHFLVDPLFKEQDIKNSTTDVYKNYLSMLEWIYNYYKNGTNINQYYFYKYNFSPLLVDLIDYINKNFSTLLDSVSKFGNSLDIPTQLVLIIPKGDKAIIPAELHQVYESQIADQFVDKFITLYEGVRTEKQKHLGVPILPVFDITRTVKVLKDMDLDITFLNRFSSKGGTKVYETQRVEDIRKMLKKK